MYKYLGASNKSMKTNKAPQEKDIFAVQKLLRINQRKAVVQYIKNCGITCGRKNGKFQKVERKRLKTA